MIKQKIKTTKRIKKKANTPNWTWKNNKIKEATRVERKKAVETHKKPVIAII